MSRELTKKDMDAVIKKLKAAGYDTKFSDAGKKHIQEAYRKVGQAGGEQIVEGFAFDIYREEAVKEIAKLTADFSKTAPKTAIEDIKKTLTTALEEGQSIVEAQDAIRDLPTTTWRTRSDTIARTEIMTASNGGAVESYKQLETTGKFRIRKVWVASGDCCEFCAPLNGETIELKENFIDLGGTAKGTEGNTYACDYRAIGYPALHPNCRCATAAEVEFL